jgi:hypothetical protein
MTSLAVLNDIVVYLFDKILSKSTLMSSADLEDVSIYSLRVTSSSPYPINDPSREPPAEVWLCVDAESILPGDSRVINQSLRYAEDAIAESSSPESTFNGGNRLGPLKNIYYRSIQRYVIRNLSHEVARHAVSEGTKAVTKFKNSQHHRTNRPSFSSLAGIVFCPGKLRIFGIS